MPPRLITLSRDECFRLLTTVPVGRVGLTIDAIPVVLPVNFALLDGDIVFRTVVGTKFHVASTDTVLAFEVDHYEANGASGWSVLVQGRSRVITDPSELLRVHH
jgi:nitroimidazol reductase NimA-like FMN-containing flavoprotein (pyridoxamine 5'-phosphate oxidase superfamily)